MKRNIFVIFILLFIGGLASFKIANAQTTTSPTSTSPVTQYSQSLPSNLLPSETPADNIITLTKSQTNQMNPWVIYISYFIIPAILAAVALFISIYRKKKLGVQ